MVTTRPQVPSGRRAAATRTAIAPDAAQAHAPTVVRLEIQGLRAVAVMLVVLYHLWPGPLPGGYIGVDVFFVISGFLITGNILREVERRGSVRLADFWARRVRRLLPAALLVLATTAVAVFLFVPRLHWQQFFKEIGAATLYVENWSLARDAVDYLASSNAPSPVQHYWTLSVEEQFYIAWPLLVLAGIGLAALARGAARECEPRRMITLVLALATLASLAYSLWLTAANPQTAYFSTFTRAWEFGAGALLACSMARGSTRSGATRLLTRRPPLAALLSLAGLGIIAVSAIVLNHETPMPGSAAIWVVAGSAAVIAAGHPSLSWSPGRLLCWRPATFIGDISYSMYLWHWPLIVLWPYVLDQPAGLLDRAGILVATILLSWATKLWVEDPVRTTRNQFARRPMVSLLAAAVAASLLVGVCRVAWSDVARESERSAELAAKLVRDSPPCFGAAAMDPAAKGCPNEDLADTMIPSTAAVARDYFAPEGCEEPLSGDRPKPCQFGPVDDPNVPHIAVIGDSHTRALLPALLELAKRGTLSIDLFNSGGCIWAEGRPNIAMASLQDLCVRLKAGLRPYLVERSDTYDFIMTTAWTNKPRSPVDRPVESIVAAWRPLLRAGVPIVAVRDNPSAGPSVDDNPNNCMATVALPRRNDTCGLDRGRSLDRYPDPFEASVRETRSTGAGSYEIDMTRYYCREATCPVVIGGVNVYRDNSHVSVTYARTMAPYYLRSLREIGVVR